MSIPIADKRIPLAEPANVVTNLAYLWAIPIVHTSSASTIIEVLVMVSLVILCIGSMTFHATDRGVTWARRLDEAGMMFTFTALCAYGVHMLAGIPAYVLTIGALGADAAWWMYLHRTPSFPVIGAFMAILLSLVYASTGSWWPPSHVALLGAGSLLIRQVDRPVGHGPLHALWHIGTGAMVALIVAYLA